MYVPTYAELNVYVSIDRHIDIDVNRHGELPNEIYTYSVHMHTDIHACLHVVYRHAYIGIGRSVSRHIWDCMRIDRYIPSV